MIRLIDALFVRKDDQGSINASMRESDLTLHEREVLGAIAGGMLGLMAGGDQESEALGATLAAQAIAGRRLRPGHRRSAEGQGPIPAGQLRRSSF